MLMYQESNHVCSYGASVTKNSLPHWHMRFESDGQLAILQDCLQVIDQSLEVFRCLSPVPLNFTASSYSSLLP